MNNKEIVTKLRDISIEILDINDNLDGQEKALTQDIYNQLNSLIVRLNK